MPEPTIAFVTITKKGYPDVPVHPISVEHWEREGWSVKKGKAEAKTEAADEPETKQPAKKAASR